MTIFNSLPRRTQPAMIACRKAFAQYALHPKPDSKMDAWDTAECYTNHVTSKHRFCLLVQLLLDIPNAHPLLDLYNHTAPVFSHAIIFSDLAFESNHMPVRSPYQVWWKEKVKSVQTINIYEGLLSYALGQVVPGASKKSKAIIFVQRKTSETDNWP